MGGTVHTCKLPYGEPYPSLLPSKRRDSALPACHPQLGTMFAEEVGNNASRKRAEAAKLRRKKIKEEQKRKAATTTTPISTESEAVAPVAGTTPTPCLVAGTSSSTKPKISAVEKAKEQREARAKAAAELVAATKIQSSLRGWYTRVHRQQEIRKEANSKLNDMNTVHNMLIAKGGSAAFVAPPATASYVLILFLHVKENYQPLIAEAVRLCLLPGLSIESKNPVASWSNRRCGQLVDRILGWLVVQRPDGSEDIAEAFYQSKHLRPHVNLLSRLGNEFVRKPLPKVKDPDRRAMTALVRLACIHEGEDARSIWRHVLAAPMLTWRVEPDIFMGGLVHRILAEFSVQWISNDDEDLELCGSTRSQRLLANWQCLGRSIISLQALPLYWKVVSALIEHVPPATFATTETAVAWINGQRPVVLNPIILEHCHWLLVDSHVRKSIGAVADRQLSPPNTLDRKMEEEVQTMTAAALAKEEANKVDRSAIWKSSKWAVKLMNKLRLPKIQKTETPPHGAHHGEVLSPTSETENKEKFFAVVQAYAILVARWGGDAVDVVKGETRKLQDPRVKSILNVLGFSTNFLPVAWSFLQDVSLPKHEYIASLTAEDPTFSLLYLFLCTFSHVLIVTDDAELHDLQRPIPLHHVRRCIVLLKKLLYQSVCQDTEMEMNQSEPIKRKATRNYFGLSLVTAATRTMRDLYDRSSRRPVCAPKLWVYEDLLQGEIARCKSHEDYQALLSESTVLRVCPYMVPFKRRLKLFERIVTTNRVQTQGENSANPFHTNPLKPGIPVRITRGRLLEDGLRTMNNLGRNMRERLSVKYYNEAGTRETGIDAGGLFKEFWTDLCAIAFDPNYALFRVTESSAGFGNSLYPNPASGAAHGEEHVMLFSFLGRILGKALYEGITIHPVFSHFTLSFLRGDYNFLHMLADLSTIDPQLYNNLMFLKTYDGDAADLSLTFTVTSDDFGGNKETPLMPNGANIDVTNQNKHLYIGLVAKFYVYDRIREQSEAMMRGLFEVIDRSWLRLFNEPELQILISGASDGALDVDDMKAHAHYSGGYTSIDPSVRRFWSVVASLNQKQQSALLRFVTSCERPPPLGFKSLNPPFTIQRVGIFRDADRLPTASTCFNVLKLPTYSSAKVLRERLIYAVESGAGFELS